jgi:protein-S-isoprenylcysteine O-methyltransferase
LLRHVLVCIVVLFPVSEFVLALRRRARSSGAAQDKDRGSLLGVWGSMTVGIALAVALARIPEGRIAAPPNLLSLISLTLLLGGLALRWTAIITLGRFFTVNVAIHSDHRVVEAGPYRYVRHPSYTGALIAFLGLGVFFGSWLSLVALMVPSTLGILNRVSKEEEALRASLGADYDAYCARTKRFLPGLF